MFLKNHKSTPGNDIGIYVFKQFLSYSFLIFYWIFYLINLPEFLSGLYIKFGGHISTFQLILGIVRFLGIIFVPSTYFKFFVSLPVSRFYSIVLFSIRVVTNGSNSSFALLVVLYLVILQDFQHKTTTWVQVFLLIALSWYVFFGLPGLFGGLAATNLVSIKSMLIKLNIPTGIFMPYIYGSNLLQKIIAIILGICCSAYLAVCLIFCVDCKCLDAYCFSNTTKVLMSKFLKEVIFRSIIVVACAVILIFLSAL